MIGISGKVHSIGLATWMHCSSSLIFSTHRNDFMSLPLVDEFLWKPCLPRTFLLFSHLNYIQNSSHCSMLTNRNNGWGCLNFIFHKYSSFKILYQTFLHPLDIVMITQKLVKNYEFILFFRTYVLGLIHYSNLYT